MIADSTLNHRYRQTSKSGPHAQSIYIASKYSDRPRSLFDAHSPRQPSVSPASPAFSAPESYFPVHASYLIIIIVSRSELPRLPRKTVDRRKDTRTHAHTHTHTHTDRPTAITLRCACAQARVNDGTYVSSPQVEHTENIREQSLLTAH